MNEVQRLEMLSEDIKNGIDELQSLLERSDMYLLKKHVRSVQNELETIISNLTSTNDAVYGVFEELNCNDTEELQNDYDLLHSVLEEKLSYNEKVEMRIKHGIDFNY